MSLRRATASGALAAIACFVGINVLTDRFKPLARVDQIGWSGITQNYFVRKLPEIFSRTDNPDILILGSSLSLYPAVRCDDELHHLQPRVDPWYLYLHLSQYAKAERL